MNLQYNGMLERLVRDGVIRSEDVTAAPLTGGVSSEILRIENGGSPFVVKRALPQLKVEAEWLADVSRNLSEGHFLKWCGREIPGSVPAVLHKGEGYFCMEWLGSGFRNWKEMLLAKESPPSVAEQAGRLMGRIHRLSHGRENLRERFNRIDLFEQLRVSPYLLATGAAHSDLRHHFEAAAATVRANRECLIHGDFSPKNILVSNDRFVLLDAEVAVFGDPAFDLAFLLNHLFLKALFHAPDSDLERKHYRAAVDCYFAERQMAAADAEELNQRAALLLPLLMLARVDGLSPVEYLDSTRQATIHRFVRKTIGRTVTLESLEQEWFGCFT
jgi:aminoglycoside phosphotransferase (APT) family kinase protein